MKLDLNCITCNINQVIRTLDLIEAEDSQREEIMRAVLEYLSSADYSKCNPEIIAGTWDIITEKTGNKDPYKEIKKYYNSEVQKMSGVIEELIEKSGDKFNTALKIAVAGNLIDFAARHEFDIEMLRESILNIEKVKFVIDHSKTMHERLKNAKTLLYLGDNCGEICLDKLFIKQIRKEFPDIRVYYGVRGKAVVNDVTEVDTEMVGMQEVAEIINNGDGSLGTVLDRTSGEFRKRFHEADMVICKGQGNFESLSEIERGNVFHMFMAKCEPVSRALGVERMSILCVEKGHKKR
jgi:uncharacterized protein with ATP-grasp and redox domains